MADRNLVTFVEPHAWDSAGAELRIDRSAAGRPEIFFTISQREVDGSTSEELTVVVPDGIEFLEPVMQWLHHPHQNWIELSPEQADAMRLAWYDQKKCERIRPTGSLEEKIRQRSIRDAHIKEAISLGVPVNQVRKFVYGAYSDTEPVVSETTQEAGVTQ